MDRVKIKVKIFDYDTGYQRGRYSMQKAKNKCSWCGSGIYEEGSNIHAQCKKIKEGLK